MSKTKEFYHEEISQGMEEADFQNENPEGSIVAYHGQFVDIEKYIGSSAIVKYHSTGESDSIEIEELINQNL